MPSQEEYLDNLLNDEMQDARENENSPGSFDADSSLAGDRTTYDVSDTANMSVEDIDRILSENENAARQESSFAESADLEQLLETEDDADSKGIQELLQKADRNEAVDSEIVALLEKESEPDQEIEWEVLENEMQPEAKKSRNSKNAKNSESSEDSKGGLFGKLKSKFFGKKDEDEEDKSDSKSGKKAKSGKAEETAGKEADAGKKSGAAKGAAKSVKSGKSAAGNSDENPDAEKNKGAAVITADTGKKEDTGKSADSGAAGSSEVSAPPEKEKVPDNDGSTLPADQQEMADMNDLIDGSDEQVKGFDEALTGVETDQSSADEITALENMAAAESNVKDEELLGDLTSLISQDDLLENEEIKEKEKPKKKKGLLAKLIDLLTEEDEEEKDEQGLILSEENDAILKELDKEGGKKKKKPKKAKGKGKDAEGAEEGEEESGKKGKKEKKPKKPKKVKEPKLKEVVPPGKKLSKRRVFLIFMICMTIGAVFLVLCSISVDFADKKKASKAFYNGEYEECYQNLVGKNLNESQKVMFGKSESILRIRLWMREYEMLAEEGLEPEALDSLLQSVHDYPQLESFSGKWNATSEVEEIYEEILQVLQEKYHLSKAQAQSIADEEDDLIYSKLVRAIAGGASFEEVWDAEHASASSDGSESGSGSKSGAGRDEDFLPEEEGLGDVQFAE